MIKLAARALNKKGASIAASPEFARSEESDPVESAYTKPRARAILGLFK
jgi:hypothetical protein